jgi:hypothetical protein
LLKNAGEANKKAVDLPELRVDSKRAGGKCGIPAASLL